MLSSLECGNGGDTDDDFVQGNVTCPVRPIRKYLDAQGSLDGKICRRGRQRFASPSSFLQQFISLLVSFYILALHLKALSL
jgi:hypothetical protein